MIGSNKYVLFGIGIMMLTSCIEHKKKETSNSKKTASNKEEQQFIEEKTYAGLRIYSGRIPCADCSGIEQRLVLKGDTLGVYRLTETYKDATEDGDAVLVSTGEWKFKKAKSKKEMIISQGHLGDSSRVSTYLFEEAKIIQTTLDKDSVSPKYAYTLRKVKAKIQR